MTTTRKSKIIDEDGIGIREDAPVTEIDDGLYDGNVEIDDNGFLQNGLHWPTIEILRHSIGSLVTQTSEMSNEARLELNETQETPSASDEEIRAAEKKALGLWSSANMASKIKRFMDTTLLHTPRERVKELVGAILEKRTLQEPVVADISATTEDIAHEIRETHEAIDRARNRATQGWTRVDKRKLN